MLVVAETQARPSVVFHLRNEVAVHVAAAKQIAAHIPRLVITREEPDVRERVFRAQLFELCRRPISMVGGERNRVCQRTARKGQRGLGSPSKDESSLIAREPVIGEHDVAPGDTDIFDLTSVFID